jgi:hypothetical protein
LFQNDADGSSSDDSSDSEEEDVDISKNKSAATTDHPTNRVQLLRMLGLPDSTDEEEKDSEDEDSEDEDEDEELSEDDRSDIEVDAISREKEQLLHKIIDELQPSLDDDIARILKSRKKFAETIYLHDLIGRNNKKAYRDGDKSCPIVWSIVDLTDRIPAGWKDVEMGETSADVEMTEPGDSEEDDWRSAALKAKMRTVTNEDLFPSEWLENRPPRKPVNMQAYLKNARDRRFILSDTPPKGKKKNTPFPGFDEVRKIQAQDNKKRIEDILTNEKIYAAESRSSMDMEVPDVVRSSSTIDMESPAVTQSRSSIDRATRSSRSSRSSNKSSKTYLKCLLPADDSDASKVIEWVEVK